MFLRSVSGTAAAAVAALASFAVIAACSSASTVTTGETYAESQTEISGGTLPAPGPTTVDTPIGLAFEIDNGTAVPLQVRAGQRFYVNQIDMRASLTTTVDEGVAGLAKSGDFAKVPWRGVERVDQSFVDTPNADGTSTRRRFFRKAEWMDQPSLFVIEQLDAESHLVAAPLVVDTGLEQLRKTHDSFFDRRMRAIQWTYDCAKGPSPALPGGDCSTAKSFSEEALIELRYSNGPLPSFKLDARTTQLRVRWSFNSADPYLIPVQQVEKPNWDYGFGIDLKPLTPPNADGTYSPGTSIEFQFTLTDGSGKRLHPEGSMPTYEQYLEGEPSGIQYYRFFQEPFATYYRRKHREHHLLVSLTGPVQDAQSIHTVDNLETDVDPATGNIYSAQPGRDGFYGQGAEVPSFGVLLSGALSTPVTDKVTFAIPADAKPGTYVAAIKGRRNYMGEELPRAMVYPIQVGTTTVTTPKPTVGGCDACHKVGGDFSRINHGLATSALGFASCTSCHPPLNFELEGPVYTRVHFIHSRSDRFDAPKFACKTCHLGNDTIQRTSKSACLACHTSYPESHVKAYGPIQDMYIGGGTESFAQCSTTCHTTHPGSGLR
jgi:hypothetical protein